MRKQIFLLIVIVILTVFSFIARYSGTANELFGQDESFTVKFHDATFHNDDEGHPIIVIHYDFFNEGKGDVNPSVAVQQEAFQDGTKLELATVSDSSVYDKNRSEIQIEPGNSIKDCQTAYLLISSVPVEFELHAKDNDSQKYVLVFDVEEASSEGIGESTEYSTKTFTYKGKNFTYDVGGKTYKTSMGTVDIESFSVNNIRATTFNDLELDYEIVGVVEEEDSLVLSLKCYDSDGFLIDTSSLYGSVRAGEKFKIDNSITVPGKTAKVELAAG